MFENVFTMRYTLSPLAPTTCTKTAQCAADEKCIHRICTKIKCVDDDCRPYCTTECDDTCYCPDGKDCYNGKCCTTGNSCGEDCCTSSTACLTNKTYCAKGQVCNKDKCCTPDCSKGCGTDDGCGKTCGCPPNYDCENGKCNIKNQYCESDSGGRRYCTYSKYVCDQPGACTTEAKCEKMCWN